MTEGQFFKRTLIGAAGLALALTLVESAVHPLTPETQPWVAPFGQPWLSIGGAVVFWVGVVAVSHAGRWIYLAITRREPNLGD